MLHRHSLAGLLSRLYLDGAPPLRYPGIVGIYSVTLAKEVTENSLAIRASSLKWGNKRDEAALSVLNPASAIFVEPFKKKYA